MRLAALALTLALAQQDRRRPRRRGPPRRGHARSTGARPGLAATVLIPEGGDFNDDLAALDPPTLAARLAPLLGPGP